MVLHSFLRSYSEPVSLEDLEEERPSYFYSPLREKQDLHAELPDAALCSIFEQLDTTSLASVLLSCKRWREIARASAPNVMLRIHEAGTTTTSQVSAECKAS